MNTLRISVLLCAFVAGLEGQALAQTCTNDTDCTGGSACGGPTCQWMDAVTHSCVPANANDWCTTSADCKCQSLGATCTAQNHCTFVTPDGAPHDAGTTRSSGGCAIVPASGALPGVMLLGFAVALLARRRR